MKKIVVLSMFVTSIVGGSVYGAKSKDLQRRESLKALEQQKLVTQQRKKLEDNASEMLGKIRASNLSDTEKRTESKKIADQLENLKRADADRVNEILKNLEASMSKTNALLQRKMEEHLEGVSKQKVEGRALQQAAEFGDLEAARKEKVEGRALESEARTMDRKVTLQPTEFARAKVSQKALDENKKELLGAQRMVHKNLSPAQAAKAKDLADEKILTKEKQEEGRKYLKAAGVVVGVGALVGVILGALAAAGVFDEPGAEPAVTPSGIPTEPTLTPAAEEPEETGMEVVAGRGSYQFED